MKSFRKNAIWVGVLYIIGTVAGILSVVFTSLTLNSENYLALITENKFSIEMGSLCVLIMGFALAFIPLLLYPVLKKQNEILALGYVVFRGALEAICDILIAMSFLLLLPLGDQFLLAATQDQSHLQALGTVLLGIGDLPMTVFAFGTGALILYILLYQSNLIPRWISVFGIIAIILHLITGFMIVFGWTNSFSLLDTVLNFPIFLQEMVMAVWLIAKGFNPNALAGLFTKTNKA